MTYALNVAVIAILIIAAGLGGYILSQIKNAARQDLEAEAVRVQAARMRRAVAKAEGDALRLSADLNRSKRRLRRYEAALRTQPIHHEPAGDPLLNDTDVEGQWTPETLQEDLSVTAGQAPAAASRHLDREIEQDVQQTVNVDRFGVNFVRREIA